MSDVVRCVLGRFFVAPAIHHKCRTGVRIFSRLSPPFFGVGSRLAGVEVWLSFCAHEVSYYVLAYTNGAGDASEYTGGSKQGLRSPPVPRRLKIVHGAGDFSDLVSQPKPSSSMHGASFMMLLQSMDPMVRIFCSPNVHTVHVLNGWLARSPLCRYRPHALFIILDTPGATFTSAYGALLRRVRRQAKYGQAHTSALPKNGREAAVERESTRLAACKNTNFVFDGVCSPILARYGFYDLVL